MLAIMLGTWMGLMIGRRALVDADNGAYMLKKPMDWTCAGDAIGNLSAPACVPDCRTTVAPHAMKPAHGILPAMMIALPTLARCAARLVCLLILAAGVPAGSAAAAESVTVGSKRFTESYILGEIVQQTLRARGINATHKPGLGNTGILEQALRRGRFRSLALSHGDTWEQTAAILRPCPRPAAGQPALWSLAILR